MESRVVDLIDRAATADGLIVILTGAGVSAESGIPTFRGEEGYWTVGSEVYRPEQLATAAAFSRMPWEVWGWYLYRRQVCRAADPNPAHHAIARLEAALGDRFRLITQNVDGLHLRAGNSMSRTYQIHGNIDFMRCAEACSPEFRPIPEHIVGSADGGAIGPSARALLVCHRCGHPTRPHVLWFDESYDEPLFRFESSLHAANQAALVVTVGTSAATTLPNHVVELATRAGAALIDVNPEETPFGGAAEVYPEGAWVKAPATAVLPAIVDVLAGS